MNLESLFGEEWYNALETLLRSEYFSKLGQRVSQERMSYTIYPEKGSDLLFKAFRTTPLSKVRVVILGQDPYHDGSYDGFAFSNKGKFTLSPSLKNIFKEVENDVYDNLRLDQDPDLERWAKQGVLLINTAHTVIKGNPASHFEMWVPFTRRVIDVLSKQDRPITWILWGKKAGDLANISRLIEVTKGRHQVLASPHPSPFSAHLGFFGSKPFSQTNKFIEDGRLGNAISW